MLEQANYQQFIEVLQQAIRAEQLVKLVLSKYHGSDVALQRLEISPVQLKAQWQLKCVYHYQTNHVTKNLLPEQALSVVAGLLLNDFRQANLHTSTQQCQLSLSKKGKFLLSCQAQQNQTVSVASHNRQKHRYVEQSQPFLNVQKCLEVKNH